MQWESLGFKDEPFKTQPITHSSLDLYIGNEEKIKSSQFALNTNNIVMVIEGARGIGTTSFGNFLRFKAQDEHKYFTPTSEIRVEPNWHAETLMVAVIANIVSSLEMQYLEKIKNKKQFKAAKAIVQSVTETYRAFGASAFGFGANYGKSGNTTQPVIMPTQTLASYLIELVELVYSMGFKYGILIQLNNLDIGIVQQETNLKILLNVMRDYFQIPGTSWLLVGDMPLRHFIAQEVDRLDDIITHETEVTPLPEKDYLALINKRIEY
jgi:hypothetical protein